MFASSQKGRVVTHATELFATKQTAMTTTNLHRDNSLGTLAPVDVPLDQLPVVELTADHIRRANELAIDRNESYQQISGGNVFGDNNALTSHETGIIGEMAVAELYSTDIDAETYEFGDSGIDVDLVGVSSDVKTSATEKMTYPQLLICGDNNLTADLYILTHIKEYGSDGAKVRILGYATREQVAEKTPYPHPGDTKNYVIEPEELTLPPLVGACNA